MTPPKAILSPKEVQVTKKVRTSSMRACQSKWFFDQTRFVFPKWANWVRLFLTVCVQSVFIKINGTPFVGLTF
jgi:hypothetical protein